MIRYILRRLGFLLLTLLLTSIIIFAVTRWLPGDVARVILGREAGEAALQALREELGLDRPLYVQYFQWLGDFVTGDWGRSYATRTDILPIVMERLRNSLRLGAVTLVISIPLAVALGVLAGLNENSLLDNVISISALSVVGLPEFVTGLVLIHLFAFNLRLLPASSAVRPNAGFFEALPMLILPALTATLVLLAYIARLTRAGVIQELREPYVRTAILKGMPYRRVIVRHVLRNALMPTITVIAISLGWLISGLIVIENVYNYPGLGRLLVFAIDRRDLPVIQAITMITAAGFAGANLLADLLYALLNPRIRLGA
ncbi:MAG TPA: ABC transporter permease [Chloroflexi bacterium]|jgi:peptide/nickel transport system permease protein|nr:ABC transporter permease [Chloroflexota bacterium]